MNYVLVMGDEQCGKTQFIRTLTGITDYTPASSAIHKRHVAGDIRKFCLQESCDCQLIPKVDAVLYLYDLHHDNCFTEAKQFADKYKSVCPVILVGTKCDECPKKEFCPCSYKHIYVNNLKERSVLRVIEFLVEVLQEDKERLDASDLVTLRKQVQVFKIASLITVAASSCYVYHNNFRK